MMNCYYSVAGFLLKLSMPEGWDADALLPSFRDFRCTEGSAAEPLMDCIVSEPAGNHTAALGELLDETSNDMGHVCLYSHPEGYGLTVPGHSMLSSRDFSANRIFLGPDGSAASLCSLLRIAYSQAVLYHDAVAVHASAVHTEGLAYMFMGPSGTGKSTHSRLWMQNIPGAQLLNDDNPTVLVRGGAAIAYGTPWSGKTPCWRNASFPLGGMVRLSQAAENIFRRREGAEAFVTLFPGCSAICQDEELRTRLYDTLARLAALVPVGTLACRPDREAALLCHRELLNCKDNFE